MEPPPYRFRYGDPGLFVELYLPKKAVYQGALYDTLTEGFDLDAVRCHFLKRQREVKQFLKDYAEGRDYTAARIDRLSPSYEGYSLYELDGVFCARSPNPASRPRANAKDHRLIEERVQVVRMIFLAPISRVAPQDLRRPAFKARRFLRFWTHDLREYSEERRRSPAPPTRAELRLVRSLKSWLDDVGLFLHGYVLYRLCERVHELNKARAIDAPEQEIWVSTFRCLAVNRTTLESAVASPNKRMQLTRPVRPKPRGPRS